MILCILITKLLSTPQFPHLLNKEGNSTNLTRLPEDGVSEGGSDMRHVSEARPAAWLRTDQLGHLSYSRATVPTSSAAQALLLLLLYSSFNQVR